MATLGPSLVNDGKFGPIGKPFAILASLATNQSHSYAAATFDALNRVFFHSHIGGPVLLGALTQEIPEALIDLTPIFLTLFCNTR
ncbi:MAG: hypothetical protein EBS79_14920 [Gammaproteobacteria bacterium]|nr:hypothetical protein [Gammaproteobacteria bacterium]NBY23195.1 hypothetical protein [Gammaproteobacteria bacterium]